jgi:hypothetical protein
MKLSMSNQGLHPEQLAPLDKRPRAGELNVRRAFGAAICFGI